MLSFDQYQVPGLEATVDEKVLHIDQYMEPGLEQTVDVGRRCQQAVAAGAGRSSRRSCSKEKSLADPPVAGISTMCWAHANKCTFFLTRSRE